MTPDEFDKMLHDADVKLSRLRALYEQYFQGIERLEPHVARKDLDRTFELLRKGQPRNTAMRFRMQQSVARYGTYQTYWQRIGRQIEEGTYKRDIARVKKKHAEAAQRPDVSGWEIDVDIDEVDTGLSLDETDVDAILGALGAGKDRSLRPPMNAPEAVASIAPAPRVATPSLMRGLSPFAAFGKPTMSRPGAAAPRDASALATPAHAAPSAAAPVASPAGVAPAIAAEAHAAPPEVAPIGTPATGAARSFSPFSAFSRPAQPRVTPSAATSPARPFAPSAAAPAARPFAPAAAPARTPDPAPRPAAAPPAPTPTPSNASPSNTSPSNASPSNASPSNASPSNASPSNGGLDERAMRAVYDRYADARRRNNEGEVRFEALAQSVEKMLPKLREKHGGKKIDFDVVVTNGRVGLKPKVGE